MNETIYGKLFILQQRFRSIKDKRNDFGNYNYRNIEDILSNLKPLLNELKLVLVFNEELINDNYLKSICKLIDVESGETFETNSVCAIDRNVKGMSDAQATGCTLTYSRKYNIQSMLAIDDGKSDPDSMNGKDFEKKETTDDKINNIIMQIDSTYSIEELTELWNKLKNWTKNDQVRNAFTERKNILKNSLS